MTYVARQSFVIGDGHRSYPSLLLLVKASNSITDAGRRRACTVRVTVLGLCVCVCVCVCSLSYAASHIGITKERYQQIHRNMGTILKRRFS